MSEQVNPVVDVLERQFLPLLQAISSQIQSEFPNVAIKTWSWPIGSATTDNPAHNLGIDCRFSFAPHDKTDNVALIIGVLQVNHDPHLSDLSVCWGAGAEEGGIGADLLEFPIPWSPHAIALIQDALPKLFETLIAALRNPPFSNKPAGF